MDATTGISIWRAVGLQFCYHGTGFSAMMKLILSISCLPGIVSATDCRIPTTVHQLCVSNVCLATS